MAVGRDGAVRLVVFVASWRIECCGEPPALGDGVAWSLVFTERADAHANAPPSDGLVRIEATARPLGAWPGATLGRFATYLDGPSFTFCWEASRAVAGAVALAGFVREDHHGAAPEDAPLTCGVVREIWVEERRFVEAPPGSRTWRLAPEPPRYRAAATSPKRFRDLGPAGEGHAAETGVLVTLDVAPGPVG